MDSKYCVNCGNKNAVNTTSNRLVTESCGHVKCMQCLLEETAGCVACKKEKEDCKPVPEESTEIDVELKVEPDRKKYKLERTERVEEEEYRDELESSDHDPDVDNGIVQSDTATVNETTKTNQNQSIVNENENRQYKLNTAHIITLSDGESEWYFCTLCKRKFNARSQVSYHAYCNGQMKPFECRECKRSFATHSHYNYHMQSKHLTSLRGLYICEVCDASFIQKSKLQRHKLIKHTKEKKYVCKECSKAFYNASSLRKHGLLHSGERPYLCSECPRRFRDSSNLKKHMYNKHSRSSAKVHTAGSDSKDSQQLEVRRGRKHQCLRCPQAFHSRKDLRRHEGIHTEQKPFECPIRDDKCKQPRFRRRDNFNRHLRNTHGLLVPLVPLPNNNGQLNGAMTEVAVDNISDEIREKAKLEVLNPLPPLPEDVMQKHLYTKEKNSEDQSIYKRTEVTATKDDDKVKETISELATEKELPLTIDKDKKSEECYKDITSEEQIIDKNVEEPVIDKSYIIEANTARESVIVGKVQERKAPSPVPAYVHKIRRAHSLSHKDVCLPPIDARKLVELVTLYPHSKDSPSRPLDVGPLSARDVQTLKDILHDKERPAPAVHWRKRLTDNE